VRHRPMGSATAAALVALALVSLLACRPGAAFAAPPAAPLPSPDAPVFTVGTAGCDFRTIAAAVAASPAGGVLELVERLYTEGGLVIDRDLFVRGAHPQGTIVQAGTSLDTSTDRVASIAAGATVVLQDLTLRYGHPRGDCPRGGGALINYGTLWMARCTLCDSIGQCGGGLLNRDGDACLFDCAILRNEADGGFAETGLRGMGAGGGVKNAVGTLWMERCTLAWNTARKKGGAVKNCCLATMTMRNCTVVGNRCVSGGVHLNGTALLDHCTITGNLAPLSHGAGVYVDSPSVLRNCIVAGNSLGDVTIEFDADGADARIENVWIGDGRCPLAAFTGDPLLGPLADNGGLTWCCPLRPGSPAIDAGILLEGGPLVDQRGLPRVCGAAPDLGAVETQEQDDG